MLDFCPPPPDSWIGCPRERAGVDHVHGLAAGGREGIKGGVVDERGDGEIIGDEPHGVVAVLVGSAVGIADIHGSEEDQLLFAVQGNLIINGDLLVSSSETISVSGSLTVTGKVTAGLTLTGSANATIGTITTGSGTITNNGTGTVTVTGAVDGAFTAPAANIVFKGNVTTAVTPAATSKLTFEKSIVVSTVLPDSVLGSAIGAEVTFVTAPTGLSSTAADGNTFVDSTGATEYTDSTIRTNVVYKLTAAAVGGTYAAWKAQS